LSVRGLGGKEPSNSLYVPGKDAFACKNLAHKANSIQCICSPLRLMRYDKRTGNTPMFTACTCPRSMNTIVNILSNVQNRDICIRLFTADCKCGPPLVDYTIRMVT
jgi:hypothetical protein